jgi:hypothetical protein
LELEKSHFAKQSFVWSTLKLQKNQKHSPNIFLQGFALKSLKLKQRNWLNLDWMKKWQTKQQAAMIPQS